jgi:hypothetical protein
MIDHCFSQECQLQTSAILLTNVPRDAYLCRLECHHAIDAIVLFLNAQLSRYS